MFGEKRKDVCFMYGRVEMLILSTLGLRGGRWSWRVWGYLLRLCAIVGKWNRLWVDCFSPGSMQDQRWLFFFPKSCSDYVHAVSNNALFIIIDVSLRLARCMNG